ncbi:MarR family winged helix-turn-helix transcriptional regulator [Caulobacter sp. DWR2-3-1b2]|uniref:MarR family winged helix-turn-helix transcriptional regulator n=1 Tax=unclassified Caulobacter TaxID=2648921 RepID=UPI003CEF3FAA
MVTPLSSGLSSGLSAGSTDPRLILGEEQLDSGLELLLLAEAALWAAVDAALEAEGPGLGRSHWRAAFLLRRRPGIGVQDLSKLTSLSKQAASKTLTDLQRLGLVQKAAGDLDARRRPTLLTPEGAAFETRVSERLRGLLGRAYRTGGLDGVAGTRRILAALAGPRQGVGLNRRDVL